MNTCILRECPYKDYIGTWVVQWSVVAQWIVQWSLGSAEDGAVAPG